MRSPQNNNVANEGTLADLSDDPPNFAEVRKAIHKLKNNKGAGDSIPSELLKADADLMANLLQPIIKYAWENEELSDGWDIGLIMKLPKKGDLKNCENWRGITLLLGKSSSSNYIHTHGRSNRTIFTTGTSWIST